MNHNEILFYISFLGDRSISFRASPIFSMAPGLKPNAKKKFPNKVSRACRSAGGTFFLFFYFYFVCVSCSLVWP